MVKRLLFFITAFILVLSSTAAMAANATLSSLTVSAGTFSPGFTSNTTIYTILESSSTTSITFKPTQSLSSSTIKINGVTVSSGSNSSAISLSPGDNTVTIVVSKSFNTTVTY